jgi:hypothetical protein
MGRGRRISKQLLADLYEKKKTLEFEKERGKSHSVENSL